MTEEIFEKATRIQHKLNGVKKLKEIILNPNAPVMDAANALARYFQANPDEAKKFVDTKIEMLQKEFEGLCECEHCKFFQPKPEEKPDEKPENPEEGEGDNQGGDEGNEGGEGENKEPEQPEQPENPGGEEDENKEPGGDDEEREETAGGEETGGDEEPQTV